jgi:hypothetical protein
MNPMIPRRKPLAACSTMYDHAVAAKEKSRDERERDDDGGKEDVFPIAPKQKQDEPDCEQKLEEPREREVEVSLFGRMSR